MEFGSVRPLEKVNVPGLPTPPGASRAPLCNDGARLTRPLPPRVAPLFTVTTLLNNVPFTSTVPLLMVVAPVKVFVLFSASVPVPVLFKVIEPVNAPLPPKVKLFAASNVTSAGVSAPTRFTNGLAEPLPSNSTLLPLRNGNSSDWPLNQLRSPPSLQLFVRSSPRQMGVNDCATGVKNRFICRVNAVPSLFVTLNLNPAVPFQFNVGTKRAT